MICQETELTESVVRSPGWGGGCDAGWKISFKVCCFPLSSCLFQAFPGAMSGSSFTQLTRKNSPVYHEGKSKIKSLSSLVKYSLVSSTISGSWQRSILMCFQTTETHCNQHGYDVYRYATQVMLQLSQNDEQMWRRCTFRLLVFQPPRETKDG